MENLTGICMDPENNTNVVNSSDLLNCTQSEHSIDVSDLIWSIGSPFLMILGTVGNGLCIFVLTRKYIRESMVSSYLTCLAVADLLALYTGLLPNWIIRTFDTDLHDYDPFICKVGHLIVYFSLDLSAWVLVSFTVERAISVWKPLHVRDIITRRVFIINMATIVLILVVVNGHFLIGYDVGTVDTFECSQTSEGYNNFVEKVFPWIDLFVFSLGPFTCHIIGNTVIVIGLKRSNRLISHVESHATRETMRRNRQIAITLLCVNLVYLICTLPISVHFIVSNLYTLDENDDDISKACLSLLMYLNNSVNFITYMLSSERFRDKMKAVLRFQSLRPPVTTNSTLSLSMSNSNMSVSRSTLGSSINLGSTVTVSVI